MAMLRPRMLPHLAGVKPREVARRRSGSAPRSMRPCAPRSCIMASAVTDFPEPLSPTMPSISPGATEKETSRRDLAPAAVAVEGDGRDPRWRAGSPPSRHRRVQARIERCRASPSPSRLKPMIVTPSAALGEQREIGVRAQDRAGRRGSCRPSSALGSWMPRPRKLSVASAMMMKPTPTEARTSSGATMFGSRWRRGSARSACRRRPPHRRRVRPAATSTSERASRAMPGHQTSERATITVHDARAEHRRDQDREDQTSGRRR